MHRALNQFPLITASIMCYISAPETTAALLLPGTTVMLVLFSKSALASWQDAAPATLRVVGST